MKRWRWIAVLVSSFMLLACGKEGHAAFDQSYDTWELKDFTGCLEETDAARRTDYRLLEGTDLENSVCRLQGKEDGATLYIVGGVHGDEKAGWIAGELLKEASFTYGTIYIISPANRYGAEQDQRETKEERDLNRNFPGDPEGCDAEQIAWAIYSDIQEKQPDFVLDLHEARAAKERRDALGNSVICQSLEKSGDLVLELLMESEEGKVCSEPLTLYGSPPPGSVNRIVTENLGIPVMTVETFREDPLKVRVRNHLEITEFVMEYLGMRR